MIGPAINSACIVAGAVLGSLLARRVGSSFQKNIMLVFGCISTGLGIFMIGKAHAMPPIVCSLMAGTVLGELFRLEHIVVRLSHKVAGFFARRSARRAARKAARMTAQAGANATVAASGAVTGAASGAATGTVTGAADAGTPDAATSGTPGVATGAARPSVSIEAIQEQFAVFTVVFSASGLGFFGAMQEGLTGDFTMLLIKSLLDLPTAMFIAANIGAVIGVLCVPQFVIQMAVLLSAGFVSHWATPAVLADFSGCGGFIMLATGLRMCGIVQFPILSMLPALLLAMPVSALWVHFVG